MFFQTLRFVLVLLFTFATVALAPTAVSVESAQPLFFTPTTRGQVDVLAGIESAEASIDMSMFRITDVEVLTALIAAQARGVNVRVLLDKAMAEKEKPNGPTYILESAGVDVQRSSSQFSISHAKTFIVDKKRVYIMTLNLTKISHLVRDVGYISENHEIVGYLNQLFEVDWQNGIQNGKETPANIPRDLVISPVDATIKLRAMINQATTTLKLAVENFSYRDIIADLIEAKQRGVKVEVLLPRCNFVTVDFNMPAAKQLHEAGVNVRLMPDPESPELPYIHQKTMSIDQRLGFVGSENFSYNSLEYAREVGILFRNTSQIRQLDDIFDLDFGKALDFKAAEAHRCQKLELRPLTLADKSNELYFQ